MIHNLTLDIVQGRETHLIWNDQEVSLGGGGFGYEEFKRMFDNPPSVVGGVEYSVAVENPAYDKQDFLGMLYVITGNVHSDRLPDSLQGIDVKRGSEPLEGSDSEIFRGRVY